MRKSVVCWHLLAALLAAAPAGAFEPRNPESKAFQTCVQECRTGQGKNAQTAAYLKQSCEEVCDLVADDELRDLIVIPKNAATGETVNAAVSLYGDKGKPPRGFIHRIWGEGTFNNLKQGEYEIEAVLPDFFQTQTMKVRVRPEEKKDYTVEIAMQPAERSGQAAAYEAENARCREKRYCRDGKLYEGERYDPATGDCGWRITDCPLGCDATGDRCRESGPASAGLLPGPKIHSLSSAGWQGAARMFQIAAEDADLNIASYSIVPEGGIIRHDGRDEESEARKDIAANQQDPGRMTFGWLAPEKIEYVRLRQVRDLGGQNSGIAGENQPAWRELFRYSVRMSGSVLPMATPLDASGGVADFTLDQGRARDQALMLAGARLIDGAIDMGLEMAEPVSGLTDAAGIGRKILEQAKIHAQQATIGSLQKDYESAAPTSRYMQLMMAVRDRDGYTDLQGIMIEVKEDGNSRKID